jgi:hypothetical protein
MGLFNLYLSTYLQNSYLQILENNLTAETRLLADRIAARVETSPEDLRAVDDLAAATPACWKRGSQSSISMESCWENRIRWLKWKTISAAQRVQRAVQGTVSTELRYSDTVQTQMLYAAAPIISGGRNVGVARMAVSTRISSAMNAAFCEPSCLPRPWPPGWR